MLSSGFSYTGLGNTLVTDGTASYSRDPSGKLVAISQASTKTLAWSDRHGDLVGTFTAVGTVLTDSTSYDPLGNQTGTGGTSHNLGYQGRWTDKISGKTNMGARWYDPSTGQFTSHDTIAQSPTPSSGNANGYGNADPLDNTDPSGHGLGGAILACGSEVFDWEIPGLDVVSGVACAEQLGETAAEGAVVIVATSAGGGTAAAASGAGVSSASLFTKALAGTTVAAMAGTSASPYFNPSTSRFPTFDSVSGPDPLTDPCVDFGKHCPASTTPPVTSGGCTTDCPAHPRHHGTPKIIYPAIPKIIEPPTRSGGSTCSSMSSDPKVHCLAIRTHLPLPRNFSAWSCKPRPFSRSRQPRTLR